MLNKKPSDMYGALKGVKKTKGEEREIPGSVTPLGGASPIPAPTAPEPPKAPTPVSPPMAPKPAAQNLLNPNLITMSYETGVCGIVVIVVLLAVSFLAGYQMGSKSGNVPEKAAIATPPLEEPDTNTPAPRPRPRPTAAPTVAPDNSLSGKWSIPLASGKYRAVDDIRNEVKRLKRDFPGCIGTKLDGQRFIIYAEVLKDKQEAEAFKKDQIKRLKAVLKDYEIQVEKIRGNKVD